jgi:hypothetical protein
MNIETQIAIRKIIYLIVALIIAFCWYFLMTNIIDGLNNTGCDKRVNEAPNRISFVNNKKMVSQVLDNMANSESNLVWMRSESVYSSIKIKNYRERTRATYHRINKGLVY